MSSRLIAMLCLSAVLAMGRAPGACAAESYDGCAGFIDSLPATIATQGVWCLRKDLGTAMASGAAITLANNNITIDCNDFKLGGLAAGDASTARGIQVSSRQNIVVRNCAIRGFNRGIEISQGAGHLVEHNRLDNNLVAGIHVASTEGALVRDNRVLATGGYPDNLDRHGIYCQPLGGRACDVRDNIVNGVVGTAAHFNTVIGIRITSGRGSRVTGNRVTGLAPTGGNAARGIYASNHEAMYLTGNSVAMDGAPAGSTGLRCNVTQGAIRDNVVAGFATAYSGCRDDGGNVAH